MFALALAVAAAPIVIGVCAYVVYPAILWTVVRVRPKETPAPETTAWPHVTLTIPVYNAVSTIRATLDRIMELEYPRERLQVLVLSDASTDGTDEVVLTFASRGVELVRAAERRGKTAAENAAVLLARGEIIVNVDATVAVPAASLKRLVRVFADPTVGVASGRDIGVKSVSAAAARGEAGYTGYEMWLRDLETCAGSIVGASGCFFAIRRSIHDEPVPPDLSWDFASTLVARQRGYRSVSVPDAVCMVPSTAEIGTELRRKSRTMSRGLRTLFHFRELMNPFRYGGFALMLISHKLLRWVPYLLAPAAVGALLLIATRSQIAAGTLALASAGGIAGVFAIRFPGAVRARPFAYAGFAVAALSAGLVAWYDALRGERKIIWNPTPRADAYAP